MAIETVFDVPVLDVALVAVNVWSPIVPVNIMPSVVRLATPEEKSPALFKTLLEPEPRPEIVPPSGLVIVTLLVEALNVVMVLLPISTAVRVLAPVKAKPSVWGLVSAKWK